VSHLHKRKKKSKRMPKNILTQNTTPPMGGGETKWQKKRNVPHPSGLGIDAVVV